MATAAGESDKLNPLFCAETAAMIQELVEGTETQEKFKGDNVSRQFTHTFHKRYDGKRGGPMKTTYPQTMTPLRAQWTTFANIDEYFDISLKCLVETPNQTTLSPGSAPILFFHFTHRAQNAQNFVFEPKANQFTSWLCRIIDNLILNISFSTRTIRRYYSPTFFPIACLYLLERLITR